MRLATKHECCFNFWGVSIVSTRRNLHSSNKLAHATFASPPKAIAFNNFSIIFDAPPGRPLAPIPNSRPTAARLPQSCRRILPNYERTSDRNRLQYTVNSQVLYRNFSHTINFPGNSRAACEEEEKG
jgi:hypothetical protein